MFLSDYLCALNYLAAVLGSDVSICFERISYNAFGDSFIFNVDGTTEKYVVFRNGLVKKGYSDTWRNPTHVEIIQAGKEEGVW